ncbi:MAG: tripartite tricarboxylate transporter TctB family protein [Chloroflexi bacterium]|nr:tripartite tricarboxylate transporter TctB family protein [Chloroflexota bacterium]
MARAYQVVGVMFLVMGVFVLYQSLQLRYISRGIPGPGFFGVWLGGLMTVLAVVFLVQNMLPNRRPSGPFELLPSGEMRLPLLLAIAALAVTVVALPILGFRLTIFGLSLFLLSYVGRQPLALSLAVSAVASVGVYYLFTALLGVILPTGLGGI